MVDFLTGYVSYVMDFLSGLDYSDMTAILLVLSALVAGIAINL